MNIRTLFFSIALIAPLTGCRGPTVNVQPIKIEPIHITMDINIKVDKQLDNRTVVTYSRGTDNSDRLSIERRVGGTTTVEGGRKRDQEGARPFVGIKRRLRFR